MLLAVCLKRVVVIIITVGVVVDVVVDVVVIKARL